MSISLSTLTNPATSDSVLLEAQSEADFLEPIVLFKNRATGSNAISNDPTQTTANDQPLSLPLIKNPQGNLGGYLYIPDVAGNYATGPSVTIGSNETWEGELDMVVTQWGSYVLPMGGGNWAGGFGLIFYPNGDVRTFSKGAIGNIAQSGVTLGTPFNAEFGFDGTNVYVDIDGVRKFTNTAPSQSGSITHELRLNSTPNLGRVGNYAIQKAKLTVNNAVVFDCDFNGSTSIEDGATSFEATTGGTVTINTGSGVDQARIVRRPKAVFNDSEMNFVHTNVGDAFFVCATESGVVSGVFDSGLVRNKFSGNGALKNSYRTDFLQTLWGMWPNTISDSQKQALVDYAKSKSAGKNWAGIENFVFFFRSSNLKSLDASYWDTGSATNFSYFLRGVNTIESLDIRGWDTSSLVNMDNFARGCTSLINISIDGNTFSDSACTVYTAAFQDTNLNQATIDDILVRINAAGTSNGTFGRTGGEYPSVTGVAAKNALQARGWSMAFSSEVLPSVLDLEPAAAYSLRALKSSEDPNVVKVRRSSDGALSDFKASEVTDGTLTDWVNTEYNIYTSDFSSGVEGWVAYLGTITPNVDSVGGRDDCLRYVQNEDNSYHFVFKTQQLLTYDRYRLSAEVYLPSSNTQIDEVKVLNGLGDFVNTDGSNSITSTDEWVTVSFEATRNSGGNGHRVDFVAYTNGGRVYAGNGTDTFYVRNIQIDQLTADGQVTTWYDQAGSNDASQTLVSNMPKLVDGGTLVTEGGQAALDFDGTDDALEMGAIGVSGGAARATYAVVSPDSYLSSGGGYLGVNTFNGSNGELYDHCIEASQFALRVKGNALYYDNSDKLVQNLWATNFVGTQSNDIELFKNGSQITRTGGLNATLNTIDDWVIGGTPQQSNGTFFDGTTQEIVIYDTDQSANRTAIETNINSHFTIY